MSLEALWTVAFGTSEGRAGQGVVIFESGRVFGGDHGYYYLGTYAVGNDRINADLHVRRHWRGNHSVFGNRDHFGLHLEGPIGEQQMSVSGYLTDDPSREITVYLTRQADLP
ncbi:MAG: GrlR family regulatory protein [Halofilum sp. (in: g-proteobacteria)]